MEQDFLKREEEYKKLNEELENRKKKLQEEAELVMKNQDNLVLEKYVPQYNFMAESTNVNKISRKEARINFSEPIEEIKLKDVPDSVADMGNKAIMHFYKAKLKKLQEDFDKLQGEYKIKVDEVRKLQKDNQKLNEDKDKWFQLSTSNKTHISKLENQIGALHARLQTKENDKNALKKENEQLSKDLKSTAANLSTTESRINRINDECEKLKLALKSSKQEEKELREAHRKEINEMTNIIKKIEKHRTELLNCFKKQLILIDNLKRQKVHLECLKIGETIDGDFMKILDWKME